MRIQRYHEFSNKLLIREADDNDLDEETTEDESSEDETIEDTEDKPLNDNPESYLRNSIKKLQRKIESLFDDSSGNEMVDDIGPSALDRSKREEKVDSESMTLKDMGAKLESSDITKSSKTHKSLIIIFSDMSYYYSLYVKVTLKEAVDLIKSGEELTDESIQKAYVKMKKIDLETFEEIGTVNRNVMMAEIDEKFIIELKLELDADTDVNDQDDEEFSFEV